MNEPFMSASSTANLLAQAIQCQNAGNLLAAEQAYGQVLDIDPHNLIAASNLSRLLASTGRLDAAARLLESLEEKFPNDASLHNAAAILFNRLRRPADSARHLRRIAAIKADDLDIQVEIIRRLGSFGRLGDARDVAAKASADFPHSAEVPAQLGTVLAIAGLTREAESQFNVALQRQPEMPVALYNLARIADGRSDFGAALDLYRRARVADTSGALPPVDIGDLEAKDGLVMEAVRSHELWLASNPSDYVVLSSRLLMSQYQVGINAAELFRLHNKWGGGGQKPVISRNTPGPADADRRPRIGFVSGDLRAHPVGYFMAHVIECLNPAAFKIFAYSDAIPDAFITPRIKRAVHFWRDTAGCTDDRLFEMIDKDRIDILVDLAGHTTPSRLMVFARKPAPVQVTWAGYPGTTGVSAIDALVADRIVVPAGEESCYVEQVIRMPDGFLCYEPPAGSPPVSALPAGDHGSVTFGCFHYPAKINEVVIKLWSRVLEGHPGSSIRFIYRSYDRKTVQDRISGLFEKQGIATNRLTFCGHLPYSDYLAAFSTIDLMLDPFPFSGGTITCDSLWMGVPVVTLAGRTFAGRQSQSFLSLVGLPELVAATPDDYIAILSDLCGADNRRRLIEMRATLRERVAASPLCDVGRFARNVEAMFRELWRARCRRV